MIRVYMASPVLKALDESFILLFFAWSILYNILTYKPYITSFIWLSARSLRFSPTITRTEFWSRNVVVIIIVCIAHGLD